MTDNRPQQRDLLTKRWRSVKAKEPSETQFQIAVIDYLKLMAKPGVIYFHVPNGELRDPRTAARLKAMGVLPGVADLVLIKQAGWSLDCLPEVLFLELKSRNGKQSPDQEWFANAVISTGCSYRVVRGISDAINVLEQFNIVRPRRAHLP